MKKEKELLKDAENALDQMFFKPTTIVKLGIKQPTGIGINIIASGHEFRIHKAFYNLTVMDTINFKNQTLTTRYMGFNNGTKWLEKKMNQLCSIKYFDVISVNIDNNKVFTFNPYQYGFDFEEDYDTIKVLDSYDHLNNLKQLNRDLSKIRTLIKTISCKKLLELGTLYKSKVKYSSIHSNTNKVLDIDYKELIRQQ